MSDVPYLFYILFTKLANVIFCTKRHPVAVNCFFFLHQLFVQDAITTCAQTLLRCLNHGAYHEILGLVRQHDCSKVVLLYLPIFHALVVKQIVTVVITDCEVIEVVGRTCEPFSRRPPLEERKVAVVERWPFQICSGEVLI